MFPKLWLNIKLFVCLFHSFFDQIWWIGQFCVGLSSHNCKVGEVHFLRSWGICGISSWSYITFQLWTGTLLILLERKVQLKWHPAQNSLSGLGPKNDTHASLLLFLISSGWMDGWMHVMDGWTSLLTDVLRSILLWTSHVTDGVRGWWGGGGWGWFLFLGGRWCL